MKNQVKSFAKLSDLTLEYDGKILVKDFNTLLMRGDKVGIIGQNGIGKSTLIRTILGLDDSAKTAGNIKLGTNITVSFFDQLKEQLDLEKSVAENVSEGSDYIEVNGKKTHILGYLQDFLFTPNRARTPVKALSGGEKARVLLAKQLLKPANVLVLDEPTNDLDMATLELLEEYIINFDGTILLISHDRAFMDNVVTQTWIFETDKDGAGVVSEYVGGYQDYLIQKQRQDEQTQKSKTRKAEKTQPKSAKNDNKAESNTQNKRKLSYKEQRELDALPDEIEQLESEQQNLTEKLADGTLFVQDLALATKYSERLTDIETLLLTKLERWDELENLTK